MVKHLLKGQLVTEGTISTGQWKSVCYENGMFVAVSSMRSNKCAWSTDGKTFTDGTISSNPWQSVCYGNGMFVAVSGSGQCAWSTDGKTFTDGTNSYGSWVSVCYGNGMFVTVNSNSIDSKCAWSTDGKTFTEGTISTGDWTSICYGNGMFVAVSSDVIISEMGKCGWTEDRLVTANSFALKDQTYTKTESDERYTLKTELQQSMTITHLAPIDEELDIKSFVIGAPVYMTGKVYIKDWENEIWNKSSVNDSIDCIPSVKTNGTWKEYLGICTHIDKESKEIKFATHGDYLVKVNDSSTYGIGDTVYIEDHEYNNKIIPVLKILSEDIPLTTKINRMTVGIVTSIIDSKTISV